MKTLFFFLLFFLVLNLHSQHTTKVYYNIVDGETLPENLTWTNSYQVDWNVEIKLDEEFPLIYTSGVRVYTLTEIVGLGSGFQKWMALDSKGETCQVSIGDYGDLKYLQIQYSDMGWCVIFDN